MRVDEKKINKFLELLPDSVINNIFYTMSDKFITHYDSNLLDLYTDYINKYDFKFEDKKIKKIYSLFCNSMIKLNNFTNYNFYYDGIHKDKYVFYQERFKREYPEIYLSKEKELEDILNLTESYYIPMRKLMEEYLLRGNIDLNKEKNDKKIINLNFPEEVSWEKVTMKFKEGLKDVEIFYNDKFIKKASYEEIGFSASKKDLKESRQWEFLKILSVLLSNTSIKTSATPKKLSEMLKKQTGKSITVENVHQIKKSLSATLQQIFKTQEDPFIDYKFKGYYEIKFKLLPEPILRGSGEVWTTASDYNDNIGEKFDNDDY